MYAVCTYSSVMYECLSAINTVTYSPIFTYYDISIISYRTNMYVYSMDSKDSLIIGLLCHSSGSTHNYMGLYYANTALQSTYTYYVDNLAVTF